MEPPRREANDDSGRSIIGWAVWGATTAILLVVMLTARVPTHLGVEAVPWDKSGTEYIWRVWWRARGSMVDFQPTWLYTLFLVGIALLVVVAASAALWLILVSDDSASPLPDDAPADVDGL